MKKGCIILMSAFILLTGCSKGDPKPQDTVNIFFNEYKEMDLGGLKSTMSNELASKLNSKLDDKEDDSVLISIANSLLNENRESEDGTSPESDDLELTKNKLSDLVNSMRYRIVGTNYNKDKTEVELTLSISHIDAGDEIIRTSGEIFDKLLVSAFTGPELSKAKTSKTSFRIFNENMSEYKTKTTTSKGIMKLSKQNSDSWLISEIDKEVINSIAFNVPNTIEELDSQLEETLGKGFYESLKELEDSINTIKTESAVRNIHSKVQSIINQKKFISYDDFIEEHPVIIMNGIRDLTDKEIELSNEMGSENGVFYVTRGKGLNEIVVSIVTNNGVITFNGKES